VRDFVNARGHEAKYNGNISQRTRTTVNAGFYISVNFNTDICQLLSGITFLDSRQAEIAYQLKILNRIKKAEEFGKTDTGKNNVVVEIKEIPQALEHERICEKYHILIGRCKT
jgi:hypothetical protein